MPEMDGLVATRRIVAAPRHVQAGESTRTIILTTFDLDQFV
jgi:CheY-like chemotaxis protein